MHCLVEHGGLLFLLLSLECQCQATEYFVSLSGDDSNPGTVDKPWKHFKKAVSAVKPGDSVTIRVGRYSEEVSIDNLHGSPDSYITFKSYSGENVV